MASWIKRFVAVKVLVKRQQTYLSMLNFAMIGYLFIKDTGWQQWYWGVIVAYPLWMWFDSRWIHGKEIDYEFGKSEMFTRGLKK